jgi:UDP-N-acetylglucosamine 2-epimerase
VRHRRPGRPALRSDRACRRQPAGRGVPASRIVLTGNTIMEATLGMLPDEAAARQIAARRLTRLPRPFGDGNASERIATRLRRFLR